MTGNVAPILGNVSPLHIGNMIPDTLRGKKDEKEGEASNGTGANFITVAPDGVIQTPFGQSVEGDTDLNYISSHFLSTLNKEMAKNSPNINESFNVNSVKTTLTDPFNINNITNQFSNTSAVNIATLEL